MSPSLEITGLNKYFGGLHVTRNVTLSLSEGELHAIIGPNGAGKTTLLSQLFGDIRPSSGTILLHGKDITMRPTFERARLGMARTFQITTLARELSVRQNLSLALLAADGHGFRFWKSVADDSAMSSRVVAALDHVGLRLDLDRKISDLSHGEQKMLELALALVSKPQLILLDEPMAGLGAEESATMTQFLLELKGSTTILLVEHDMDAVFRLADVVTVLVRGEIIATGVPSDVRSDPRVREAYLGEDA